MVTEWLRALPRRPCGDRLPRQGRGWGEATGLLKRRGQTPGSRGALERTRENQRGGRRGEPAGLGRTREAAQEGPAAWRLEQASRTSPESTTHWACGLAVTCNSGRMGLEAGPGLQRLSQGASSHGDAPTWPVEAVHSDTRGFYFRHTGSTSKEAPPAASPFRAQVAPQAQDPPSLSAWPWPFLSARGPLAGVRVSETQWAGCCPSQGLSGWLGFQLPMGLRTPRGPEE